MMEHLMICENVHFKNFPSGKGMRQFYNSLHRKLEIVILLFYLNGFINNVSNISCYIPWTQM